MKIKFKEGDVSFHVFDGGFGCSVSATEYAGEPKTYLSIKIRHTTATFVFDSREEVADATKLLLKTLADFEKHFKRRSSELARIRPGDVYDTDTGRLVEE